MIDFVLDMINMVLLAYISGMLETQKNVKRNIVAVFILIFAAIIPDNIKIVEPITVCECILLILYMKGKFFQKIAWCAELQMIIVTMDVLVMDIIMLIGYCAGVDIEYGEFGKIHIFIRCGILVVCAILLKKKSAGLAEIVKNMSWKISIYIIVSLGINLMLMLISQVYFLGVNLSKAMPVFAVCALLFGWSQLILCVVLQYLSYSRRELGRLNEINQRYIEQQKQYYEEIDKKNQILRKFRHDFHAQVTTMNNLVQNNQMETLKTYLCELSEKNKSVYYVYTGNVIANAVVNQIYEQAVKNGIHFKYEGDIPENVTGISDVEFCSVLSNALQNALEAAGKAKEKDIKIKAEIEAQWWYIRIDNTFESIVCEDGKLVTQKEDKQNHGLGMENIQQIMKKCGGVCRWKYEENHFSMFLKFIN